MADENAHLLKQLEGGVNESAEVGGSKNGTH